MTKPPAGPLHGSRIRLRLLHEADLPLTLRWRNRDEIRKWFFNSDQITEADHRTWFASYSQRHDDLIFVIEDREHGDAPIGQVALYNIDIDSSSAEFGRLLIGEPAASRRGLARAAIARIMEFARDELGLRHLYLHVKTDNVAAINAYRACGFTAEREDAGSMLMSIGGLPARMR